MKRFLLFAALILSFPLASTLDASTIHYLTVEGIINPVTAEFITNAIEDSQSGGSELVVIQLDTPGGLDLSMRDIVKSILNSNVPVVVYVAPSGSRAASAGVFIAYAAHIAAMAPGTNIGSAHPVAIGGKKMDETMAKKVENDAVAYLQSIAKQRNRNEAWAEEAVRESVNITAEEALKINVVDLVAATREELLNALNGRAVELSTGRKQIKTSGAVIKDVKMGVRLLILNAITNPNIAYILMMIGLLGLYFELSNPGTILPGVVGAISLVLAFYAFQTLTINYAGLALIGLAIIFFIAEINVFSYGLLTLGGVIALLLGSLMLFESPLPFMKLSLWVIMPTILFFTAIVVGVMYLALRIHRRPSTAGIGSEGLIGKKGRAETDISREGKVYIEGEYWDAWSDEEIDAGERIEILAVEGLKIKVKKTD